MSPVRARSRVAVAALVAVIGVAGRAGAREDHDRPDSYALTAWTAEKGLPGGDIFEMSQDLEGYLWLGMTSGLVRFDGSQFAVWGSHGGAPLPGLAVSALVAARNGSVWVGFGDTAGGVSRIRNGRVVGYTEHDGLPKGPLATLLEDRRGAIWAGGRGGLSTFRDERWETVGSGTGFTDAEVYSLYEDRDGTLWVGSAVGVYRRRAGRFEIVDQRARYVQSFAEATDGTLWVTDTHLAVRKLDASDTPVHDPMVRLPAAGWRLLHDRHGQLWVAALGGGLLRVRSGAREAKAVIERFSYEGTIGGSPRSVFEDRDGHVWIGMRGGGLLRLSESVGAADVTLDGLTNDGVRALSVDADGNVWVATGQSLNRFSERRRQVFSLPQVQALHTDRIGNLWVSTSGGVGRLRDGRFLPLVLPQRVQWQRVNAITTDESGDLWLCSRDQGLMRWHDGTLALQAGAVGYLLKDTVPEDLVRVIREVHSGGRAIPTDVAAVLATRASQPTLTLRGLQVLELLATGKRNKEIAGELGISGDTTRAHIKSIFLKFNVHHRTAALAEALSGIIHIG